MNSRHVHTAHRKTLRVALRARTALSILAVLAACGGGGDGDSGNAAPATASTLAYVVTECRIGNRSGEIRQALQIRQGDGAPMTVAEHSYSHTLNGPFPGYITCAEAGRYRNFNTSRLGVFHRLGVSPDGSQVVFEVSNEPSTPLVLFPANLLPEEETGMFVVNADGTGLRRLGAASRVPPYGEVTGNLPFLAFSPNGRHVAYTDLGPGVDGDEASQIFILDLGTGERTQITHLPPEEPSSPSPTGVSLCCSYFLDDRTIAFFTNVNADGMHPDGELINVAVDIEDKQLTVIPPPVAIPGSQVQSIFQISGSGGSIALIPLPKNGGYIREVFAIDRDDNVLQLTNFRRSDTWTPTLSENGQRVFFSASTNRLGTNPTENCQIFSIDRLGGDLRQVTDFREGAHSATGCNFGPPPLGCPAFIMSRDTRTNDLVFYSSCDPFGSNPHGIQVFAMHQDGSGLNQLTSTRGYVVGESTTVIEIPWPFAYPGQHDYHR